MFGAFASVSLKPIIIFWSNNRYYIILWCVACYILMTDFFRDMLYLPELCLWNTHNVSHIAIDSASQNNGEVVCEIVHFAITLAGNIPVRYNIYMHISITYNAYILRVDGRYLNLNIYKQTNTHRIVDNSSMIRFQIIISVVSFL